MRIHLLVLGACVLGGLAGCQCSGGRSSDGGIIPGSVATYSDFCATQTEVWCAKLLECKTVAASAAADCKSYIAKVCGTEAPSVAKGYLMYDSTVAADCLSSFQSQSQCDAYSTLTGPSCSGLLKPVSASGAACLNYGDCKITNDECLGASCSGTCQPTGGANQPCGYGTNCDLGLWCDASAICRMPQQPGATCKSDFQCDGRTGACDTAQGKCVALPGNGQPCSTPFDYCAAGTYCDFTVTPRVCRTQTPIGQPCPVPASCGDQAYCDSSSSPSKCQPRKADGAACSGLSSECQLFSLCDETFKVCERLGASVGSGQPCSTFRYCMNTSDDCKGEKPNPDGGVGTPGVCQPKAIGDPCLNDYYCPAGAYCRLQADGGGGACLAGAAGTPCARPAACPASTYCGKSSLCVATAAAGAACELGSSSCSGAAVCRPSTVGGTTGLCGDPGLAGAACASNDYRQCSFPFECAGGICTESGRVGESCLSLFFGTCVSGACTSNKCGPIAADGMACRSSFDCTSNDCESSKCQPKCP